MRRFRCVRMNLMGYSLSAEAAREERPQLEVNDDDDDATYLKKSFSWAWVVVGAMPET